MTILKDLYYGNINPWERQIQNGSEYQVLQQKLSIYLEKLEPMLSNEEKQLLEQIGDIASRIGSIYETDCFEEGFRLGAKIMLEILWQKNEHLIGI